MNNIIQQKIVEVLNAGGVIIYPTDTAFGIGCRMDDSQAIEKVFSLRKRPETMPVSLLVSSIAMAREYVSEIPIDVEKLMTKYWPGGLTIVLESKTDLVAERIRGGTTTVGIRMPDYQPLLDIITQIGVPILGPSANFHGEKTPYISRDLSPELVKQVDYIMPGEAGGLEASTVIDCTKKPWKVIRLGSIKI